MNNGAPSRFSLTPVADTPLTSVLSVAACLLTLGVCQAADPPEVPAAPTSREEWRARLNWAEDNCPVNAPDESSSGVTLHDFGRGKQIVEVECERMAYQGTRLFYLLSGGKAVQLSFDQFESPDVGQLERYRSPVVTGMLSKKADAGYLDIVRKYRGVGDCGQFLRYAVEGDQAVLKELRVRECGKLPVKTSVDPRTWPIKKP